MDGMTPERFRALAEAYGGDLRLWPQAERPAAERLRAQWPGAEQALAQAAALDQVLDAWTAPAPSAALEARILRSAPAARARPARLGLLWPGLGLALAGAAGALAGALVMALAAPRPMEVPQAAWAAGAVTAFGDLATSPELAGQDS